MPTSLLNSLHDHHPPTGPIQGRKETCKLILEHVFAIYLEQHSVEQVNGLVRNRRSLIPKAVIDFIEDQIGPLAQDAEESANGVQLETEIPTQPHVEPSEERWLSLQTYLEDSEMIGRIIHAAWLGDKDASTTQELLQIKFTESLDQRPRLGRTVRKWPTSVDLVAGRLKEGWSRPDDVRALLVVLDCCTLPMGAVLLDELRRAGISINQARASLALEPTLTCISRKALAAGRRPERAKEDAGFEPLFQTSPEVRLWRSFWHDSFGSRVITEKTVLAERKLGSVLNLLHTPTSAAYFIVFNELDHLVHASSDLSSMTYSDMVGIARRWMGKHLIPFLDEAVEQRWRIAVTSDHGCTQIHSKTNVELGERTLAQVAGSVDIREMGERAIWPREGFSETLAQEVDGRLIHVSGKPCILLPSGVVSPRGSPFGFAHGGISLEEVVVPYIEIGAW